MALLFGMLVGFALGLTGGGGSIFAVPLLVYGLRIPVHEAVGLSLLVVGLTALAGAVVRWRRREVEVSVALLFGGAGMMGAPLGSWLGARLPAAGLLTGFALLMLAVAVRLWRQANRAPAETAIVRAGADLSSEAGGPACRFHPARGLRLTTRCAGVLALSGLVTGALSGLFGVGGGFLITPALMLAASLPIQRAVATSLLVITLISAAGAGAYVLAGHPLELTVAALFAPGGLVGMALGIRVSRRLAGPTLQKGFAGLMVAVAGYTLLKTGLG